MRRTLRIAPGLVLAWSVATFVAVQVSGVAEADAGLGAAAARSVLAGAVIGLLAAWAETRHLARWSRRLSLPVTLGLRTLLYAALVAVAMAVLIGVVSWRQGFHPAEALRSPELWAVLASGRFALFFALLVLSSFLINFGLQLRRVLGPATLRALFLGTYRRPVLEERAFVFLDLTDSTAIAERLGPMAFTEFKNDFFGDVAEPVLATGGRIVQYVGDEVMVTWPMRRAERDGAPLRFVWLVEDRIAAQAERYARRHGVVPAFKAGVHGGPVVTAEVGDLHRDIVHSGDVVNTAARIEAECRPRGERLLVSEALLERMPLPADVACHAEALGALPLRGKAEAVGVMAVRRGSGLEAARAI